MAIHKPKFGSFGLAVLLVCPFVCSGATSAKLTGSIAGFVRDGVGVPQMGATVVLLNRYERIIQRAMTNEKGLFGFEGLIPDLYSVHVNLASFVPAMKQKIAVQPGMQSLLYINMAGLLSSIELVYAAPGQGALMSDDWRWTLKTATETRPVLRVLPESSISNPNEKQKTFGAIFSDTRGMLRVSAGDAGTLGDLGTQPDLGTAFALNTSFLGSNELQFSGNVGHTARVGIPAASFRTSYSRGGVGPEVALTMRQVYLPSRAGITPVSGQDVVPALRTMSVSMIDRVQVTDDMRLEYGISLDSVTFFDRLNYFSPFARLTYDLGNLGTVRAAYSSGAPPAELFSRTGDSEAALHRDLLALSLVPLVSLHDNRAAVQRTQNLEIGYEKKSGNRTFDATAYREIVSNGGLTLSGPNDLMPDGDVLPDISSNSAVFNIGSYQRYGYSASLTQRLGETMELSASSGRGGALIAGAEPLEVSSGDEIRSKIHATQRYWAAIRASGVVPVSGTQVASSYQWMDYNTILPNHLYLTQNAYPEAGWNIHIRQPIPSIPGMIGRLEATADLRNLLAQGYLPIPSSDARRLLLVQSPRAVRGGLSFIF
ncbi:MAG: TonB-dependent receptor domain-containing protein [Bryobacteraceae bacterium]